MGPTRLLISLVAIALPAAAQPTGSFEAPQTRPMCVQGDDTLFALATPTHEVVEFSLLDPKTPTEVARYRVGLEPVAVAARGDELWVVNWLSDSVSVVSRTQGCVVATIHVGDEPGDVVFAGSPARAFVSVSGSDEVVVIDVVTRAIVARVPVFGDAPRALATSGTKVWVAALRSGNGTTIIPGKDAPPAPPPTNVDLASAPQQGIIVKATDPEWRDLHDVVLPDCDVFEIDAASARVEREYSGVGTILFALAVDPVDGDLWVTNTESHNTMRFEPALRGRAIENRVTRIARRDEPAIDVFGLDVGDRARALAMPTGICFAPDGQRVYVAAFGSDRIAVLDREGRITGRIELGPRAEVQAMRGVRACRHHPSLPILYAHQRFAHAVGVVDTERGETIANVSLGEDPTPDVVRRGRPFLYSADLSGDGSMSCASCHIDADWDGLAWDLGSPSADWEASENRGILALKLHPMKGPMTTQTLRGLTRDTAPFHRRGDRAQLQDFNASFDTLLGGEPLAANDMNAFAAFLECLQFPPNPNRGIDGRFAREHAPEGVADGETLFHEHGFQGVVSCVTCHAGHAGTSGVVMIGRFLQYQAQPFKVPQLRDVYKRTARIAEAGRRKSGFGLFHDGSVDRVATFLERPFFRDIARSELKRAELERFVLAFDTGTHPAVGWSWTVGVGGESGADFGGHGRTSDRAKIELAEIERVAQSKACRVLAYGVFEGALGRIELEGDSYRAPDGTQRTRDQLLAALQDGDVLTFYAVPY